MLQKGKQGEKLLTSVLIGYGYWGPNLARNFHSSTTFNLISIIEENTSKHERILKEYPGIQLFDSIKKFQEADISVDVAIIATPSSTHADYGRYFLHKGCHIWVEKPFVLSSKDGDEMIEYARKRNLKIFVDHTFQYSPSVREIKRHLQEIGEITYINSTRSNFGIIQSDTSVIWDLAIHDFSIIQYLVGRFPESVIAKASTPFSGIQDSVCTLILNYESFLASIHVNWLSPFKSRDFLIGGIDGSILFDDTETAEKVRIYSQSIADLPKLGSAQIRQFDYKYGPVTIPNVANEEALRTAVSSFATYILNDIEPPSSGSQALELIKVLEACELSIQNHGQNVKITKNNFE